MTELMLLAQQTGVDERTLRRAINQGSLRAERPTARRLEISLAERRYVRRAWPLISSLRRALRTDHNVRFALMFGSVARGTDRDASDIDILVALRDSSLDRVVDLAAKLSGASGRQVDLVRVEDAESQPSFFAEILSESRVLVDRDAAWNELRGRSAELRASAVARDTDDLERALAGLGRA